MDPKKLQAALDALIANDTDACAEILKGLITDAAAGGAGAAAAPAPETQDALADTAEPPPEEKKEDEAALAALKKLAGKSSAGETVAVFQGAMARLEKIDADARDSAAALDMSSRRELIGELVKCGAEFPSTAWKGKPEDRVPVDRLASESLESLRERVTLHKKNRPPKIETPSSAVDADGLTPDEVKLTAKMNAEQKARFVALRKERRKG